MDTMRIPLLRLAALLTLLLIALTMLVSLRMPIPGDWALVQWALSLRNDLLTRAVWLLTFITSATPALLICAAVSLAYAIQHRQSNIRPQPLPLGLEPQSDSHSAEQRNVPVGGWGRVLWRNNLSGAIKRTFVFTWPLVAFAGALTSNIALRIAVRRMRPSVDYIPHGLPELQADFQRFSFPSGHAGAAVVAFVSLAALAWPHKRLRWPALLLCALVIAGTGFGRVYLGVHWPSDVIAGYLLAGAWLAIALYAAKKLR